MRHRHSKPRLAAQFAAGLLLAGAAFAAQDAAATDLTVAVNTLPRSLDSGSRSGNVDVRVYYSIYDTLIRRDFASQPDGSGSKLVPGLAESWTRTGPSTLDVTLRQGVTCNDGKPFNADDVLATFSAERLWGPASYYPEGRDYFGHLQSVEKLGDYKVRFTTAAPDLILEQRLASYQSFVICDEALMAFRKDGVETKTWMEQAEKAMQWAPVTTGPYKAVEYQKNSHLVLQANPTYWGGKPAAEKITFREVPEMSARLAGVVSGEFDIAVDFAPDQWQVLDSYKDVKSQTVSLENSHILVFNSSDAVLGDKRLRQALSLGIDRKALIDALWKGKAFTPNGHQIPAYGDMYVADREGYAYDPDKARDLVKASGYKGEEISYRLIPNYYLNNVEAAQIIQEMWRAIGVNVRLDFVDNFTAVRNPGAQIFAWSNSYRLPDPTGGLLNLWGPDADTVVKHKYFKPSQAYTDLAQTVSQTTDAAERKAAFSKMLDIFEDEMPMTMLYNPTTTYAVRQGIRWNPYSLYYMDFRPTNFAFEM